MDKARVYKRKVSLIDALVLQGAKVEELAYFFNMSLQETVQTLELEAIEVLYRGTEVGIEEEIQLLETRQEFIDNLLAPEGWTDDELCCMFSIPADFKV